MGVTVGVLVGVEVGSPGVGVMVGVGVGPVTHWLNWPDVVPGGSDSTFVVKGFALGTVTLTVTGATLVS